MTRSLPTSAPSGEPGALTPPAPHPARPCRRGLLPTASLPTWPVTEAAGLARLPKPEGTWSTFSPTPSFCVYSILTSPSLRLEPSGSI